MNAAKVPAEVKDATARNHVFEEARLAVARKDLAAAKAKAAEYARLAAAKKVPFEIRLRHEIDGRIALAEKRYAAAAEELARANQQDPAILYLIATAWRDAGDAAKAAAFAKKAARFNGLAFTYAYVKVRAAKIGGAGTE